VRLRARLAVLADVRICRNEHVIYAHIYTPSSIFRHGSLDLIRDRRAAFPPFW